MLTAQETSDRTCPPRESIPVRSSYYRARYYDSTTGRFLSEDPLRFMADRGSFYEYTYGDPTNFLDPSGMQSQGSGSGSGTATLDPPTDPPASKPTSPRSGSPP